MQARCCQPSVPTVGWTLAFAVPDAVVYAPLAQLLWQAVVVTLVSLILMLVLVFFSAWRIVQPLAEVQHAAQSVAARCLTNLSGGMHALARGDLTVAALAETPPVLAKKCVHEPSSCPSVRMVEPAEDWCGVHSASGGAR